MSNTPKTSSQPRGALASAIAPGANLKLDVDAIILTFGGRISLYRNMKAHLGSTLSIKTVESWKTRQSIPTARLLQIMQLAKIKGMDFDITQFVL